MRGNEFNLKSLGLRLVERIGRCRKEDGFIGLMFCFACCSAEDFLYKYCMYCDYSIISVPCDFVGFRSVVSALFLTAVVLILLLFEYSLLR